MKSELLNRAVRSLFPEGGEDEMAERLDDISNNGYWPFADSMRKLVSTADAGLARFAVLQQITVELSGDVLSDWNFGSGLIETGKQWKTMLGYTDLNSLGDRIDDWKAQAHPDDLNRIMIRIAALAKSQANVFRGECRLKHKSGEWRRISIRGMMMARDGNGNAVRMLMLQRDVTAFRAAEELALEAKAHAEEANRARGAFLANMSHEIRTPMNAIIGMTELALDTSLNEEQRHYLTTVKSSAEALLTIINDILDFSKIEAGKLNFEAIPFSFHNIVHEAVRTLAVNAHKKNLELAFDIDGEVPPRLVGDPTRLRQVVMNLLGNAIKFTEQGEVFLSVEIDSRQNDTLQLHFKIRDTGVGIPADRQEAIFEAFSQVDDSTTRRFGGTGLGLTICSNLVQLMRGEIWVESEIGKGSIFHFTGLFPIENGSPATITFPDYSGKKVLLIAENKLLQEQFRRIGSRLSLEVQIAPDLDAVASAMLLANEQQQPFYCVFADAKMTDPCGMKIAETWQNDYKIPLVMVITTDKQRQDLDRLRQLNLSQCLVRPLAINDITAILQAINKGDLHQSTASVNNKATNQIANVTQNTQEKQKTVTNIPQTNQKNNYQQTEKIANTSQNHHDENDIFKINEDNLLAENKQKDQGLEILLVEDNPINQDLAKRLLEKAGHKVTIANNGKEAVDIYQKKRYRYILMDMQMPIMGGIEATESIRNLEMRASWISTEEVSGAYIIAMTANAMDGDRERCLQAGMNEYITKPIRPDILREALEKAVEETKQNLDEADQMHMPMLDDVSFEVDLDQVENIKEAEAISFNEEPSINIQETINDLGDEELVHKMAEMLIGEWQQHISNIENAYNNRDGSGMQIHSHTLKSLLALFHAEKARQCALELESACKSETINWEKCEKDKNLLFYRLSLIEPILSNFVAKR